MPFIGETNFRNGFYNTKFKSYVDKITWGGVEYIHITLKNKTNSTPENIFLKRLMERLHVSRRFAVASAVITGRRFAADHV